MIRRPEYRPPLTDPLAIRDVHAAGFEVEDFEDWLRLIAWSPMSGDGGNGGAVTERRKTASLVIPRSGVHGLIDALRHSAGPQPRQTRHS